MSRLMAYTHDQIPYVWDRVKDHLQRGIDKGSDYTLEEVLEKLCKREMQLWVSWNGDIEAALVTSIETSKQCKFCVLAVGGGDNLEGWMHYLSEIEDWARRHDCEELRIYGRPGWARVLDFDMRYTAMSKKL